MGSEEYILGQVIFRHLRYAVLQIVQRCITGDIFDIKDEDLLPELIFDNKFLNFFTILILNSNFGRDSTQVFPFENKDQH